MTPMSVTANFAREGQGVTNRKLDITCITLTWKILLYLFHLYYLISPCRGSCWSWAPSSCYPNACCRPEINTWGVLSSFMCFKNPSCSKLVRLHFQFEWAYLWYHCHNTKNLPHVHRLPTQIWASLTKNIELLVSW